MINPFKPGDEQSYNKKVNANELAHFESGEVHDFYATFALAKDAEWVCRLFVLQMKEDDEEGIGTYVNIEHHAPALEGEEVQFTATLTEVHENNVYCTFEAKVGQRLVASGSTGQKVLKKSKLAKIKERLNG